MPQHNTAGNSSEDAFIFVPGPTIAAASKDAIDAQLRSRLMKSRYQIRQSRHRQVLSEELDVALRKIRLSQSRQIPICHCKDQDRQRISNSSETSLRSSRSGRTTRRGLRPKVVFHSTIDSSTIQNCKVCGGATASIPSREHSSVRELAAGAIDPFHAKSDMFGTEFDEIVHHC